MTLVLEQVAGKLNVTPHQLLHDSVLAYVAQQERLVDLDIADLRDRYGVASSDELAARITTGQIYSHPAWEDLMEWQHLEAYRLELQTVRAETQ